MNQSKGLTFNQYSVGTFMTEIMKSSFKEIKNNYGNFMTKEGSNKMKHILMVTSFS